MKVIRRPGQPPKSDVPRCAQGEKGQNNLTNALEREIVIVIQK